MNKFYRISFFVCLILLSIECPGQDSSDYMSDIPGWLQQRIKEMSIDEKHYAGTKVFKYEVDGNDVFWINNPWSSCVYCELYYADGNKLDMDEIKRFSEDKGEAVLIWENYPPVHFDSLKKNLEEP